MFAITIIYTIMQRQHRLSNFLGLSTINSNEIYYFDKNVFFLKILIENTNIKYNIMKF